MPKIQKEFQIKSYKVKNTNQYSVDFDGTNDYIITAYNAALNPSSFTVEAWVKVEGGANTFRTILSSRNISAGNGFGYILYATDTNKYSLWTGTGGASFSKVDSASTIKLNAWTHVAGTFSAGTLKIYVNGVLAGKAAGTYSANTTRGLLIGAGVNETPLNFYFNGKIDEVKIWNYAMTDSQIKSNFFKKSLPKTTGLVAYYELDTGSGTTAFDSSLSGINGTLTNGPSWSTDFQPLYLKTFAGRFPVYEFSSFSSTINSGLSDATIKLPKKFDNYGKDNEVDYNNQIEVYVFDKEKPGGQKIYSGYILGDKATVDTSESVEVQIAGYVSKLTRDRVQNSSNQYKFTYTSAEHGAQIKKILDDYKLNNPAVDISYTDSSIVNTSLPARTLAVSTTEYLDAINAVAKMAGAGFYYFIDADNVFNFKAISTNPDHYFTFEKDIASISINRSIANTFNELLFAAGTTGYSNKDTASQIEYGRLVTANQDNRYTDANSINSFISSYLEVNKDPFVSLSLTIIDSNYNKKGYDIESIQVGQTFKIRNYDGNSELDSLNIITNLTYNDTYITVESQNIMEYLEREIFELKNSQSQINISDGPITY